MRANQKRRRKSNKFNGGAKVTLAALSLASFIGSWNLIARLENQDVQANQLPSAPTPYPGPALPTPTPWPTIPSFAAIPPIPTLVPTLTALGQSAEQIETTTTEGGTTPIQVAPIPTLAPLPALAPLPTMPPPPPPAPAQSWDGGNHSGGS